MLGKKVTRRQYLLARQALVHWQAVEMRERALGHARKARAAMDKAVDAFAIIADYRAQEYTKARTAHEDDTQQIKLL